MIKNFNPRTHTGCDRFSQYLLRLLILFQSTHPYRVRPTVGLISKRLIYFNPRTHTGCDLSNSLVTCEIRYFNPRTHTGCDDDLFPAGTARPNFNPRTHTGCDLPYMIHITTRLISIHAPIQGATPGESLSVVSSAYFNPRTHTGCDYRLPDPL